MKVFFKIIFLLILPTLFLLGNNITFGASILPDNCRIDAKWNYTCDQSEGTLIWDQSWSIYNWWISTRKNNIHMNNIQSTSTWVWEFTASSITKWDQWIYNIIIKIARDLKNLVFVISTIYFLIIVFKLLLSDNTEEELANFKKWVIWISIWIVVMQVAYGFIRTLTVYNGWVIWQPFWQEVYLNIIEPLIKILEMWASFAFIAIAIYAFYKIVTSNWDDEKAKTWKMTIVYAIIWFIVIKISRAIVETVYWKINCDATNAKSFFIFQNDKCIEPASLSKFAQIVLDIINWMNGFVWIITVIMIIYVWAQIFLSAWDEEKLKNGKKAIIYIIIWLFILFANYLILTFFFPTTTTI